MLTLADLVHVCECAHSKASEQHSVATSVAQGWQPYNISQAEKRFRIFTLKGIDIICF